MISSQNIVLINQSVRQKFFCIWWKLYSNCICFCQKSHLHKWEGRQLIICRHSRSLMFCKINVLNNFAIFTGKHLCCSLFLINLQTWRSITLLKRDSNTSVSLWPVNIAKILRTVFLAASVFDLYHFARELRQVFI